MTLADIASGNTGTADVLFLIAAIAFGLATVMAFAGALRATADVPPGNATGNPHVATAAATSWHAVLVDAGLCLAAVALLLL